MNGSTDPSTTPPPSSEGESAPSDTTGASTQPARTTSDADGSPGGEQNPGAAGLVVTAADRAKAADLVAGMSLADRAASVVMVTGAEAIGTGLLAEHHFGGVILFAPRGVVDGTAAGTPAQVAAVTAALRDDAMGDPATAPPLIATDQEYGLVQRLTNGFTDFPNAETLGNIKNLDRAATLTRRVAHAAAQEMTAVGVMVDFAPVFGVLPADGSVSAIGKYGRAYGSDPQRVARLVAAAVTGYQAGGVVASMKHFPGLARIAADSHTTLSSLNVSCANWAAHEAIPAAAGIDAGTAMVMTGHMLLPSVGDDTLPASISPIVVGDLLLGDGVGACPGMGFEGVAITDSMRMAPIEDHYSAGGAAVAALIAGEDMLLMPGDPVAAAQGLVAAVGSGALDSSRLSDAATAVLALRLASARVPRPPLGVVRSAAHQNLAAEAKAAAS